MALKIGSTIELLITAKDRVSAVITGINKRLFSLKTAATAAGTTLVTAFTGRGLINLFRPIVSSAASFEEAMDRVAAKSGGTVEEIEALRAKAEELGNTTRFTATEAAQGFEILAQAGISARDSLDVLPAVLNTAIAASTDLATATTLVTDALFAFKLPAVEATRVADVLAQGSLQANTSIEQLGQALSYVGAQARASGLSLEQTVALIDALAQGGLRGERAGTGFRNILGQLADKGSKFRDALRGVGIDTDNAVDAFTRLAQRSAPQVKQALQALDLDARLAGQALVDNAKFVGTFSDALLNAAGVSREVAERVGDNLNGALRALASAWDAVQRTVVNQDFLDRIKKRVGEVTQALRNATQSDAIVRFRDILIEAFESAATSVGNFVRNFNFQDALDSLKSFANAAPAFFRSVATIGVKTAAALNLAYESLAITFNLISAGLSKIEQTFTRNEIADVTQRIELLQRALDNVTQTQGFDSEAARAFRAEIGTLNIRLAELGERADQAGADFSAAMEASRGNVTRAQDAVDQLFGTDFGAQPPVVEAIDRTADAADKAADKLDEQARASVKSKESQKRDLTELRRLYDQGIISQTTLDQLSAGFGKVQENIKKINNSKPRFELQSNSREVSGDLDDLQERLDKLSRGVTIPIRTSGGLPAGISPVTRSLGGPVPGGYGGGDRVSALLEPGEYVIRKEAVRHYGPSLLRLLNSLRLPRSAAPAAVARLPQVTGPQHFAAGGPVAPAGGEEITLTFRTATGAARARSSRQDAAAIVDLLTRAAGARPA